MLKIDYAKLGFLNGLFTGLLSSMFCVALLSLIGWIGHLGAGYESGRLDDFVNGYPYIFLIAWTLFCVGLPAVLLLWHRRFACTLGMLLVVVPVGTYMWLFSYGAALGSVKCLGSCG